MYLLVLTETLPETFYFASPEEFFMTMKQDKIDKMNLELSLTGTCITVSGLLIALEVFIFGNSEYSKLITSTLWFWAIPILLVLIIVHFGFQMWRIQAIFVDAN